jgi:primosomal protein N' (replication factor Y)
MPKVELVDLRSKEETGVGVLSRTLVEGIHNAFNYDGQVMLLLNRRGFSTQIQCPDCGQTVSCPNCDLPLTYHKEGYKALCHYCNYNVISPKTCPSCGSKTIRYTGTGTQKLEAEIRASFPGVEIARLDSDTAGKLGQHEQILSKFRAGQVKILLGTQMIAKGLDFPNVLTVGVINADNALHFPDFRAAERAFQLITQVAGRAGRGNRPGRVIVQTFTPEHYALVFAVDHNYSAFFNKEIIERKKLFYPPFTRLVRILLRGFSQQIIESYAQVITRKIESKFKELGAHMRILGPAKPPIEKIKNKFRIHIIVLCEDSKALKEAIGQAYSVAINASKNQVELIIDVDAVDML